MPTAAPSTYDVHQDYVVLSPDPNYKGRSAQQEFLNGRAELRGLPKDAGDEAKGERIRHLEWFHNAGYEVGEAEFLRMKEKN